MSFTAGFTCSKLPNRLLYTSWALCLNPGREALRPLFAHEGSFAFSIIKRYFEVSGIHWWPNHTPRKHAHPDRGTMQIHTRTQTAVSALRHPVQCSSIPVFSGLHLQVISQGLWFGTVHHLQWYRCAIQFQSAAAQGHLPRHSIKNTDHQVLTRASIHVDLMSWPLLGPHVVGVFFYGAGNESRESEHCCCPGDKRQCGPRSRAKEAPGSAPGPRGPQGDYLNNQVFQQQGFYGKVSAVGGI